MENSTNVTAVFFNFRAEIWITDTVICSISTLLSLYIFVALVYYHVEVEKPFEGKFLQLSSEKRYGVLSKFAIILIAIGSLIGNSTTVGGLILAGNRNKLFYQLLEQNTAENVCSFFSRVVVIGYSACSSLVILFLWFRQSVFYVHASLRIMNFTLAKRFSFALLIVYITFYISICTAYLIIIQYRYVAGNCLVQADSKNPYFVMIFSWIIATILMQIALLGLFIYPICQDHLWIGQNNEQIYFLRRRAKKAAVLASICFVTDLLLVLVRALLHEDNATIVTSTYSVNLVINQLATIACFDYWKNLLWPWSKKYRQNTSSTMSTNFTVPMHTSIREIRSSAS